jgi:hypothetical protein
MGVGQLVSGLTVRQGAPWAVVGEAAINLAPPPVKNFAISAFGSNDKNVLVAGILVVLAIFAAVIGVLALRRLAYGYAGLVLFAVVGVAAAISLPKANAGWAAPTVFGALVAAFFMKKLTEVALAASGTSAAIPLPHPTKPARLASHAKPVRLASHARLVRFVRHAKLVRRVEHTSPARLVSLVRQTKPVRHTKPDGLAEHASPARAVSLRSHTRHRRA